MRLRARITDLELKVEALRAAKVDLAVMEARLKDLERSLKGFASEKRRARYDDDALFGDDGELAGAMPVPSAATGRW